MLTPDEMQKKIFALGRKLENNDVGMFVKEIQINYQFLYNEVNEKKAQIKGMESKLQHYRTIETSLQEAMVSAEKMSEQKLSKAEQQAKEIEKQAYKKADDIIRDAQNELETIKKDIENFKNEYINYQDKYREFVSGQMKFIEEAKKFMIEESVDIKPIETSSISEPITEMNNEESVVDSEYATSIEGDTNYNTGFFENADLEDKEVSAKSEDVCVSEYSNLKDEDMYAFDKDTSNEDLEDTVVVEDTVVAVDDIVDEKVEDIVDDENVSEEVIEDSSNIMDDLAKEHTEVSEKDVDMLVTEDVEVLGEEADVLEETSEEPEVDIDIPVQDIEVSNEDIDLAAEKEIEMPSVGMDIQLEDDIEVSSEAQDILAEETSSEGMDIQLGEDIETSNINLDITSDDGFEDQVILDDFGDLEPNLDADKDDNIGLVNEQNDSLKATIKSIMTPIVDNISDDSSLEEIIANKQSSEENIEEFVLPDLDLTEEIPDFNTVNEQIEIKDLNNNMIDDSIEVNFENEFGAEIKEHEFELPQLDMNGMGFDDMELFDEKTGNISSNDSIGMELPNIDDVAELPDLETSSNEEVSVANAMPDLSINSNIELVNINKSLYSKTRTKQDKNAEILKSMNLTSKKKEDPLLDLPPKPNMESFFSQELLASNMKMMQESMEKQQEEQKENSNVNQGQMFKSQPQGADTQGYNGPSLQNNQMMGGGLGNQPYNGPSLQNNQMMGGGLGNQPYNGPSLQDNQMMGGGLGNQPYNGPSLQDNQMMSGGLGNQSYNGPSLQNRF